MFITGGKRHVVYQRHNCVITAAQVWWLNLIIQLAIVSIIHEQKIVNIKISI